MEKQDYSQFKQKVQDASDIVEVISSYVPLQKRGRDWWACCPFHGEKTPSFSVSKDKQFFYCYGCHAGGDVFTFVEKMDGCTFPEAVKKLAERAGIQVPRFYRTARDEKKEKEKEELLKVNSLATDYFRACLNKTDFGATAKRYLHDRGITDEIIERFSLGASLQGFGSLIKNMAKKGITPEAMHKAGLVREKNGRYMDFFIGRVMIPIKDPRGNVIAFGGRVMGDDQGPKYLNTGETVLFQKRETLFGLDVAIKAIRAARYSILVEGYMDAISLHAAGVTNAVASLGTAFTKEQAKMLRSAAPTLVFSYDSDAAGLRNAVRAVSIANAEGLETRVLVVKDAKDPDEYVRKFGAEAFQELARSAVRGTEFQIRYAISQNNISDMAGKARAVSNILPYLHECPGDILREEYIRLTARLLVMDEGLVRSEYERYRRDAAGKRLRDERYEARRAAQETTPAAEQKAEVPEKKELERGPLADAERGLLMVSLYRPSFIKEAEAKYGAVGYSSEVRSSLAQKISSRTKRERLADVKELFAASTEDEKSELALVLSLKSDETDTETLRRMATDCVKLIRRTALQKEYERHSLLVDKLVDDPEALKRELNLLMDLKGKIKDTYG